MSQKTNAGPSNAAKSSSVTSAGKSEKQDIRTNARDAEGFSGNRGMAGEPGRSLPSGELRRQSFQAKLRLGRVDDPAEREADAVADQVVDGTPPKRVLPRTSWKVNPPSNPAKASSSAANTAAPAVAPAVAPIVAQAPTPVKRAKAPDVEDQEHEVDPDTEKRIAGLSGSGEPLPNPHRSYFEGRMGRDFSSVRIHRGAEAAELASRTGARAFTAGQHIVFGSGEFSPESTAGKKLIAHELTHVVQQGSAGVSIQRREKPPGSGPAKPAAPTVATPPATSATAINEQNSTTGVLSSSKAPTAGGLQTAEPLNAGDSSDVAGGDSVSTSTNGGEQSETKELSAGVSGEPEQVLKQLESTPPTGLISRFNQAKTAVDANMEQRIAMEQANMPTMPAPTGMTAGPRPKKPSISRRRRAVPRSFRGTKSDRRRRRLSTKVVLPADSRKTPTTLGPRPKVDGSGAADPGQVTGVRKDSERIVREERSHNLQQAQKDFGENKIRPAVDGSVLKAEHKLKSKQLKLPEDVKNPGVPMDMDAKLNQSVGPELRKRIQEQTLKAEKGEQLFKSKKAAAGTTAEERIKKKEADATASQKKELTRARDKVNNNKKQWRSRVRGVDAKYRKDARSAADTQLSKIRGEQRKGEQEADKHFDDAERKAQSEKSSALAKIKKIAGGVLDFLGDTAKALAKGIERAIKAVFDALRTFVKRVFEAAKKLAVAAIELARKAVVLLIRAFGEILKGFLNVALAAFPRIAAFFNRVIDGIVNLAVKVVDEIATLLKKAVTVVLDWLAKAVDLYLSLLQTVYSGIFSILHDLIDGKWRDILKRLGWLAEAAGMMPGHFMGALSQAILGQDINKPLPFEKLKAANTEGSPAAPAKEEELKKLENKNTYTADDIQVQPVANLELAPELMKNLLRKVVPGGELIFGESTEPWRNVGALLAEQRGEAPGDSADRQVSVSEASQQFSTVPDTTETGPDLGEDVDACNVKEKQGEPAKDGQVPRVVGPFNSAGERLGFMGGMIRKSVSEWFACNWPIILAGSIAAIAAFVGLFILTGGAITAAIPPLLKVFAAVMLGVALAQMGVEIGKYLKFGWDGKKEAAAKSLALALAIGTFELLSAALFNVGRILKIAKRGLKVAGKQGVRAGLRQVSGAVKRSAKRQVRETRRGFATAGQKLAVSPLARASRAVIQNGKIVFPGLKKGALRNVRTLRVMGRRLLRRFRFRKFRIRRRGFRFFIDGFINPWVILATGEIRKIDKLPTNRRFGQRIKIDGVPALIIRENDDIALSPAVQRLLRLPSIRKGLTKEQLATLDRLAKVDKIPEEDVLRALKILEQQKAALKEGRKVGQKSKKPTTSKDSIRPRVEEPDAKRVLDDLVDQVKSTDAKAQMLKLAQEIGPAETRALWSWYKKAVAAGMRKSLPWKNLLPEEIIAIRAWTGKNFENLQKALRSGDSVQQSEYRAWIRFVITGLEKIKPPSRIQPVIRIIDETLMSPSFKRMVDGFQEGSEFVERGISGAHTSVRDAGVSIRPGGIAFEITHKNAKSVRAISQSPKEAEVTFRPGSKFRITEPPIEKPLWKGGPILKVYKMEEI